MSKLLKNTANAIAKAIVSHDEEFKLPAYVVLKDIKKRNAENEGAYTLEQHAAADAMFLAIEEVYGRSRVFMNYRQRFIAVKVNAPQFGDKVSLRAAKLDAWADANGIVKEHTRYGHIVYRATAEQLDTLSTATI